MLDDLELFPYLARFCKEEGIERLPFKRSHKQLGLKDYIASSSPSSLENMRIMLNDCLKFAYRHCALDKDRRGRLNKEDYIRFWSLINELRVGMWLENQGGILQFEPPARNGRIGDYEVEFGENSIFIEVKTIFGDKNWYKQERFVSNLANYLEQKKLPVSGINLVEYPNDFDNGNTDHLFVEIETFIRTYISGLSKKVVEEYRNRQGLSIKFTLQSGATHVISYTYDGIPNVENQINSKLEMQTDKKTNPIQVSAKDIPNMVVIYDFGHNIIEPIIEGMLYGTGVNVKCKEGTESRYRKKNGLWDTMEGKNISAVAIFNETVDRQDNRNVKIYLCPEPKFPLPVTCFNNPEIKWLGLSGDDYSITKAK